MVKEILNLGRRKVTQINRTLFASMPIEWCKNQNIRKGDEVEIVMGDTGDLLIKPIPVESED